MTSFREDIQVRPNDAYMALADRVRVAHLNAAAVLQALQGGIPEHPALPETWLQTDFNLPEPIPQELRLAAAKRWVVRHALADVIEPINALLLEVYKQCLLLSLHGTHTTYEEVQAAKGEKPRKFRKWPLPDKIKHLKEIAPGVIPPSEVEVLSIFRVRNCLMHHDGVVNDSYADGAHGLTLRYRETTLTYTKPSGERVVLRPSSADEARGAIDMQALGVEGLPASGLRVEVAQVTKTWKVGETIELSVQEFAQVLQTVLLFGREVVKALVAHMKTKVAPDMGAPRKQGEPPGR